MRRLLYPALWLINCLIFAFMAVGFGFEWIGVRLIPTQKYLTRTINGQGS